MSSVNFGHCSLICWSLGAACFAGRFIHGRAGQQGLVPAATGHATRLGCTSVCKCTQGGSAGDESGSNLEALSCDCLGRGLGLGRDRMYLLPGLSGLPPPWQRQDEACRFSSKNRFLGENSFPRFTAAAIISYVVSISSKCKNQF